MFGRFGCVGWMNAKTPDEEFSVLTFACVVCEEFQRNICYFIVTRSWMVTLTSQLQTHPYISDWMQLMDISPIPNESQCSPRNMLPGVSLQKNLI